MSGPAAGGTRRFVLGRARRRIAEVLVRAARLAAPGPRPAATELATVLGGREELDPASRSLVTESLEGDLAGLVDDAAAQGIARGSTEDLLVTAALLRWLNEDGELPPPVAVEILEVHAAVFNGARHEEERALQSAFADVLAALVGELALAVADGRWRGRQVNREATERRERRRFGERLDEVRGSRGLTIGALAARSTLEAIDVVELAAGAREVDPDEILLLARGLGTEPADLVPPPPSGKWTAPGVDEEADDPPDVAGPEDR